MTGKVLTVAESDASGAAGIQADIKTVLALGGYAATAVSSVTTKGADGEARLHAIAPSLVAEQMDAALSDIGADAIKVGYLPDEATINAVAGVLDRLQDSGIPVVIDPSIVARDGSVMADDAAIAAWKRRLYIRATILTPNLRETEILSGMRIRDIDDMRAAADIMRTLGVENVLLKAGQALGGKVVYFVAEEGGETVFERDMLPARGTLGAGGTLSAAIAIGLGQGMEILPAVERALDFLHQAIQAAPPGDAPVNHAFDIERHSSFFQPGSVRMRKA